MTHSKSVMEVVPVLFLIRQNLPPTNLWKFSASHHGLFPSTRNDPLILFFMLFFASLFAPQHGILQVRRHCDTPFWSLYLLCCVCLDTTSVLQPCHIAISSGLVPVYREFKTRKQGKEPRLFLLFLFFLSLKLISTSSVTRIRTSLNLSAK